jgi:hypothetical protein
LARNGEHQRFVVTSALDVPVPIFVSFFFNNWVCVSVLSDCDLVELIPPGVGPPAHHSTTRSQVPTDVTGCTRVFPCVADVFLQSPYRNRWSPPPLCMVLCHYLTRSLINQLIGPVLFGLSHISASCLTHTLSASRRVSRTPAISS